MPADIDNLFTPQQATALLGKSHCQVWRYGRDGTLRSVVVAGKRFNPLQGSDQGPQLRPTSGLIYPVSKSKGPPHFQYGSRCTKRWIVGYYSSQAESWLYLVVE